MNNDITEVDYLRHEVEELKNVIDYLAGKPPKVGYKWIYDSSRNRARQEIDLENADINHPVFQEWIKDQKVDNIIETFNLWKSLMEKGDLNSFFKANFYFRLNELIPEGLILLKKLDKEE